MGGGQAGGFPIWTCPSFFFLLCDVPDLYRELPDFFRDFSGLVLVLFLDLLKAPTRNIPEKGPRHNQDPSRKKWITPRFGNPWFTFSRFQRFQLAVISIKFVAIRNRIEAYCKPKVLLTKAEGANVLCLPLLESKSWHDCSC